MAVYKQGVEEVAAGIPDATVGDYKEEVADTEETTESETYVKLKEIVLGRTGAYRIKFDMKKGTAGTASVYARIYKNGVAEGTEQTEGTEYVTKSEDISGWSDGDLCQLYGKEIAGSGGTCYVKNFQVFTGNPIETVMVED